MKINKIRIVKKKQNKILKKQWKELLVNWWRKQKKKNETNE